MPWQTQHRVTRAPEVKVLLLVVGAALHSCMSAQHEGQFSCVSEAQCSVGFLRWVESAVALCKAKMLANVVREDLERWAIQAC